MLKERVRVGRNRPRKAPSREHLKKISTGNIGESLPTVQLQVLEDDEVKGGCVVKGVIERTCECMWCLWGIVSHIALAPAREVRTIMTCSVLF